MGETSRLKGKVMIIRFLHNRSRFLFVLLSLSVLTGCNNKRLVDERNNLYRQNQELQQRLNETRSALDSCLADSSRLEAQLGQSRSLPPAAANTGFDHIPGVDVLQGPGQITVRVPGDVLFASGKVSLRGSAKSTLNQIAGAVKREYGSNTIRIEGYTDTDPIRKSKWKDNLELSLQRAASVHRYLQKQGISADHMYAAGYGETRPRGSKSKSRRVEIVVEMQ